MNVFMNQVRLAVVFYTFGVCAAHSSFFAIVIHHVTEDYVVPSNQKVN